MPQAARRLLLHLPLPLLDPIMRARFLTGLSVFVWLAGGGSAAAASVTLAWDRNSEPDVTGYVLLYGTSSGQYPSSVDVGNRTDWTLASLADGRTYYFIVRAYNSAGLVSGNSNEVSTTTPAAPPPSALPPGPPFGAFDTPAHGATGIQGSIAVTGWALDDTAVDRVEIWRDRVAGETTPTFSSPGHPGHGRIFIANAFFSTGSRPDVEATYPTAPQRTRSGWGYMLLTWGLWQQGNGSYTLHAFAFDNLGTASSLGSKTITASNATANKPFGAIDTPAYGQTVSGSLWNFGWALTPGTGCTVSNVWMSIDSGPLVAVSYGAARTDIAASFPGFTNSAGAGGAAPINTSTLSNGVHTIGWLVTDSCGRSDGIGSRFFSVQNGSTLRLGRAMASHAEASATEPSLEPVLVRRNQEDAAWVHATAAGTRVIELAQTDRIEVTLPQTTGRYSGRLENGGARRPLPLGSSLDPDAGVFYWQPAPGFLGAYDLAFEPEGGSPPRGAIRLRAVVGPPMRMVIDTPRAGSVTHQPFLIQGWALDLAAAASTGIDAVHVWAYPLGGGQPVFAGAATLGDPRDDVAATYGGQFKDSAYGLVIDRLPPGTYDLVVYPHRVASGTFEGAQIVRVTIVP
jgi:hypothetical protein